MASAPGPAPPSKSPPSDSSPPPPSDSSPPPPSDSSPPPPSSRSPKSPPPSPPSPPPPPPPSPPLSPPESSSSPSPPNDDNNDESPPPPPPDSGGGSPPSDGGGSPPSGGEGSPPSPSSPPPSSPPPLEASTPPSWGPQTPPSTTFTPPTAFVPPAVDGGVSPQPPLAPTAALSPPPSLRTPPRSSGGLRSTSDSSSLSNAGVVAGIAVGGFVVLALIVACVIFNRKKKKPYYMDPNHMPPRGGGDYYNGSPNPWNTNDHVVKLSPSQGMAGGAGGWGPPPPLMNMSNDFSGSGVLAPSPNMALGFSKSQFSYDDLAAATGGFAQANLLGQGGFGYVHKGVLPNGQEVAVKSLKSGSGQGEREFQAEVDIISRVHHRHLVSLVGYCIMDAQRMLVYEFVPNGTLEFHLHGKGRPVMDWQTRLRIALGSAKGLAYLHEDCHPRIIHRDIKAANILLDDNFEAMVADFGLAKLSSANDTHVSTRVMGTFGYLAPEYASSGKLTEKSDVFSFGVMLLELLTGRKPVDPSSQYMDDSLVDWARPLLTKAAEDGNYDELVDPRLERNYDPNEVACLASCAAASIRHSAKRRPKMSQIVRALEGDASLDSLNEKTGPTVSSLQTAEMSSAYDTRAYNDDMMKFRKMVMSSQEFPSSEYEATSEASSTNSGPHK